MTPRGARTPLRPSELAGEFRLQRLVYTGDRRRHRGRRDVARGERLPAVRPDRAVEIADRVAEPDQAGLDIGRVLIVAELVDLYSDADDRARRHRLVGLVEIGPL